jgi:hypothetical protein
LQDRIEQGDTDAAVNFFKAEYEDATARNAELSDRLAKEYGKIDVHAKATILENGPNSVIASINQNLLHNQTAMDEILLQIKRLG